MKSYTNIFIITLLFITVACSSVKLFSPETNNYNYSTVFELATSDDYNYPAIWG